jgi:chemotaxis methyl-accepting protein methylase
MTKTFDLSHVCFQGRPAAGFRALARRGASRPFSPSRTTILSDEPATGFVAWIIRRAGLNPSLYRAAPLLRRLPALLRMLKVRSAEDAQELLQNRPDLLPKAINSLLIGVTEFFRDAAVFEGLRAEVLPALAARGRPIRVWSAGCSTGEELYSLAILLAEAGLLASAFLLGTDCRAEAIEQARWAVYNAGHLEAATVKKYFRPCGNSWQVIEPLRRQTHWKVADVGQSIEEGPWDIVLWRNMAIYVNPGPAESIWNRLAGAVAPDGYLIVGKAERPPSGLGLAPACRCIYRRVDRIVASYQDEECA